MDLRAFLACCNPDAVQRYLSDDAYETDAWKPHRVWSCEPETPGTICALAAGSAPGSEVLRSGDVRAAMTAAAHSIRPWVPGHFGEARRLQEARGNYGHVNIMWSKEHGRDVAVKQMPNSWVAQSPQAFEARNRGASERPWVDLAIVSSLNRMGCPHVPQLHGIFRDEEHTYVVTSLAAQGDLFAWHAHDPSPGLAREALMLPIMTQVLEAVSFLHSVGLAHRDLSLENILLADCDDSEIPQVQLIDFAMSTVERSCRGEARGKVVYQSPEMHKQEAYDPFLADCFALGVVLLAVASRDYPWTSTRPGACQSFAYVADHGLAAFLAQRRVRKSFLAGGGGMLAEVLSPAFVELLDGLLAIDPARRWGLGEPRLDFADGRPRPSACDCAWLAEVQTSKKTSESSFSTACTETVRSDEPISPVLPTLCERRRDEVDGHFVIGPATVHYTNL